jgi:hypothetical protein
MMTAGATLALMSLLLPGPDPPRPIFVAGHENPVPLQSGVVIARDEIRQRVKEGPRR